MVCTNCGFTKSYCDCEQTPAFRDLKYTNDSYTVPVSLVSQLLWVKENHRDELKAWEKITDCDPKGANQRKALLWAVTSVQTRTELLDKVTDGAVQNLGTMKEAVEKSTDGIKKWEKVLESWTEENLGEKLADSAREDNWEQYLKDLIGLQEGYNARIEERYVRMVKGHLMAEIFGDDKALCLDSARRDILEPLFEEMFTGDVKSPHRGKGEAPYRGQSTPAGADPAWPGGKRFLEDWMVCNPHEYRAITEEVISALKAETGMTQNEISHALFILGNKDGATAHKSLAEMLD